LAFSRSGMPISTRPAVPSSKMDRICSCYVDPPRPRSGFLVLRPLTDEAVFETYSPMPKLATLLRELSWSKNLLPSSGCNSSEEREFYLISAARGRWSHRELYCNNIVATGRTRYPCLQRRAEKAESIEWHRMYIRNSTQSRCNSFRSIGQSRKHCLRDLSARRSGHSPPR
jgi:hypothetical protein